MSINARLRIGLPVYCPIVTRTGNYLRRVGGDLIAQDSKIIARGAIHRCEGATEQYLAIAQQGHAGYKTARRSTQTDAAAAVKGSVYAAVSIQPGNAVDARAGAFGTAVDAGEVSPDQHLAVWLHHDTGHLPIGST